MVVAKRFGVFWLAGLLIVGVACKEDSKRVIKTAPIAFTKEGELNIYRTPTDSLLAHFDIEIADSDYETQTGLMYRNTLKRDRGMLFVFPDVAMHSFYMKNTEIPLDILFIDENLKVASLRENTTPLDETGLSSEVPVKYVLEINAGLVQKFGLRIGDSISYQKQ